MSGSGRMMRNTALVIGVLALTALAAFTGAYMHIHSSAGRFPVRQDRYPEPRIRSLLWPVTGYPALVVPGGGLEVELSGTGGGDAPRPEGAKFRARITPVRSELQGLYYDLTPERAWMAGSGRWPRGTRFGGPKEVLHVDFEVPREAVPELYDLTVVFEGPGGVTTETQRRSVGVVESQGPDFRFITLADIHVHRRGVSRWMQGQTDRGVSRGGRPLFFEEALRQVNLIRPDFVVLLGDFVRAQDEPGDYLEEFDLFMETLDELQVPAFAVPGNHDKYVNEVDGARVWEENLGPLHYSFDFAGCHFTVLDTYQWPSQDRAVMEKFGIFAFPRKWQGQVLHAREEGDPATYEGQLAWARDDLAEHRDSRARFLLLHHSPYAPGGGGAAFENEKFGGLFEMGGGGAGRTALMELCSSGRVDMLFSGHLHSDDVGRVPWAGGRGETMFASQTCVYFDEGGTREKYPGYRLVEVADGKVAGFTYLDGVHSVPFYDGSVPGGLTDLERLERPALSADPLEASPSGTETSGWLVKNYLGVPVRLDGLVSRAGGHGFSPDVTGGETYRTVEAPGGAVVYVRCVVPAGVPGKSAAEPGRPAKRSVMMGGGEASPLGPLLELASDLARDR